LIINQQLREAFLTPQMEGYFQEKLPRVSRHELTAQIEECLKFLFISRFCPGNIPVTQAIDDVWHLWILETREYCRLCSSLAGGDYIHHSSNIFARYAGDTPRENTLEDDVSVLGTYVLNFGPFQVDRVPYWRMAAYLVTHGGMTLGDLNAWLTKGVAAAT
jgi:hypothetical protein